MRRTERFLAGRQRERFSGDDLDHFESMINGVKEHQDGRFLVKQKTWVENCHLVIEGFVFRTIQVDTRRRIVGLNVPGDFIDLHGFVLGQLDYDLVAAGPVKVGSVPRERLAEAVSQRPAIARAMWLATLLDGSIHRRWIQILGQLETPRRIAHFYAELHARLELVGRKHAGVLRTPFTQIDLGDMCGVSTIHANRAVGKLRKLGVCDIRRGDLYTNDWAELKRYACFDDGYLHGGGTPPPAADYRLRA